MKAQKANSRPKEAYHQAMYYAFVAIRAASHIDRARKIAHVFHNLPALLMQEWSSETEAAINNELEAKAAEVGLTEALHDWLDDAPAPCTMPVAIRV